jgi:hypothetical protein
MTAKSKTATASSSSASKGRPKGATTKRPPQKDVAASRCFKCQSTERTEYFNRRELAVAGLHPQTGEPYTSIVIRRTKCRDCGQHRDDRQFLYQPQRHKQARSRRKK